MDIFDYIVINWLNLSQEKVDIDFELFIKIVSVSPNNSFSFILRNFISILLFIGKFMARVSEKYKIFILI